MGERGPRPEPTAIKLAAGTRKDRINRAEPAPTVNSDPPAVPEHLDDVSREVWERLAPDLHRARLLTAWDLETFARYCELASVIRETWGGLNRFGPVIEGRRDGFVVSPLWRVYRDACEEQRRLAHEFGLTPSARSGIHVIVHGAGPPPRSVEEGQDTVSRSPHLPTSEESFG